MWLHPTRGGIQACLLCVHTEHTYLYLPKYLIGSIDIGAFTIFVQKGGQLRLARTLDTL